MDKLFNKSSAAVATLASIGSIPLSFWLSKEYMISIVIFIALFFYFVIYALMQLIKEFSRVFEERTKKIDGLDAMLIKLENNGCKNICKSELSGCLDIIKDNVQRLNTLNETVPLVDIISIGTDVFKCIIITSAKEAKEYSLEIQGSKVQHVKISHVPILDPLHVGKSDLETRDDTVDVSGTKKIFKLVTHPGINLCQLELSKVNKEDAHIDIDFLIKDKDVVLKRKELSICH